MPYQQEDHLINSWNKNAAAWAKAIRDNEIESRSLITNRVIVDAIAGRQPKTVLDVGCGEGWLARELHKMGIMVHGIDVVPALVEEATRQGGGSFQVLSYQDLSSTTLPRKFDLAVANFSLLGDESVKDLFFQLPALLNAGGYFIVQTLHPASVQKEAAGDGWKEGSWAGFSDDFTDPPAWYFRTMASWEALYQDNGFEMVEILEPEHPLSGAFASVVFVGRVVG